MRWRLLCLTTATLSIAGAASANHSGSELWRMVLEVGSNGHWRFLDAGHVRAGNQTLPVVLLGEVRKDRPPGRYYEMKVVDGRSGRELWDYDGSGGDYVYAFGPDPAAAGEPGPGDRWGAAFSGPRLRDVDGDGSDDVLFTEEDTIYHTVLRALRITP